MGDRDCNKCVWHTDGNCKKWDCEYKTVEDIRADAIDAYKLELLNAKTNKVNDIHKASIWVEFKKQAIDIAEQLKRGSKE